MKESLIPTDVHYTASHEWVRVHPDGTLTIGITDHAQELLGDLVFVELPEVGRVLSAGEGCAVVESVKAAADVYSPVEGAILEVNEALADHPDVINKDPYGEGWILKLETTAPLEGLLDPAAYRAVTLTDAVDDEL